MVFLILWLYTFQYWRLWFYHFKATLQRNEKFALDSVCYLDINDIPNNRCLFENNLTYEGANRSIIPFKIISFNGKPKVGSKTTENRKLKERIYLFWDKIYGIG